jgi:cytochrome c oxidase accessory protein FixG
MSAQHDPLHLIATSNAQGAYASKMGKAKTIVTKSFTGRFRNLRIRLAGILLLIFFATPWLNWQGRQAVLWDLDAQRFHVLGTSFMPQDFLALTAILMLAAVGLLASNVLVGRAWCGYTCPQSVWTWMFMWAEKITEGDRNQRIRLGEMPWSTEKLARRTAKHSLWLAMSVATGATFVGYFVPVRELWPDILKADWFNETGFWLFLFTLTTYLNAGWLREQVCLHMCPYSRFQSVIFDRDTLVVTYDTSRGENRGSRKKDLDHKAAGLGDCIDCYQCVQVCPTGIDIRNGLQLDCIGCGACIDACDSIMDKMDYPKGLIRYSSEREQQGQTRKFLRPLVLAYGAALLATFALLAFSLESRAPVALSVAKDRQLYKIDNAGRTLNVFILKITNKTQEPQHYEVQLKNTSELTLLRHYAVDAAPGEIVTLPVSVVLATKVDARGSLPFRFSVEATAKENAYTEANSIFTFPLGRPKQ